ncbi:MAG: hypothetical protein LLG04_14945 [Parachlamydia sp.]|nr:hypothetical protein [Parachlamydia sp.]
MANNIALLSSSPIQQRDPSPLRPIAVESGPMNETIAKVADLALQSNFHLPPGSPRTPTKAPAALITTPPKFMSMSSPESPAKDELSPPSSPSFRRALKPLNRAAPARKPGRKPALLDFEEEDLKPLKTPPAKKGDTPKQTPVGKFIGHANQLTPDHTATRKTLEFQGKAMESAVNRPSPDRQEALERLGHCARSAMQRSLILKLMTEPGKVTGMLGWKNFSPCWPAEVFQQVVRHSKPGRDPARVLLNLTHLDNLELTEGGQSVKGKHIHDQYLPGACVNRKTQVWCAMQKVDAAGCLKEAKFSTYFPLLRCSHQEIIDLVTEALQTPMIANKGGLVLVQPSGSTYCVEIAMHNNIISTVIPILDYGVYASNTVFNYDLYQDATLRLSAHQIALDKVLPVIRAKIKEDSPEIRYQCSNGDLIIDIAYFLKEAGFSDCPIQKGILVRFPRSEVFRP